MKKHYVIEIFLMIIIMGLSGLLIIEYYNMPKNAKVMEETEKEKNKTEYLLGIGYDALFQLENYLEQFMIKDTDFITNENGSQCYTFLNMDSTTNFLNQNAKNIIQEKIFSFMNENNTNYEYCNPTNNDFRNWITNKTVYQKENVLRKELTIKEYKAEEKTVLYDLKIYYEDENTYQVIPFIVLKENDNWIIKTFWKD